MRREMGRNQLVDEVRSVLAKTGFYLTEKGGGRGLSFDLVGRRDDLLLFLKILQNVDAFSRGTADELRALATSLRGSPLVVGERSGSGPLEDGVIYSRFGVPIVSRRTFVDLFEEGVPPFMFSAPGGLFVRIDAEVLRAARDRHGVSLGDLAEVAGVSRRTIQMYMEGMSATVDIAMRLEEFLREPLVLPVDPFAYTKETGDMLRDFEELERFERDVFRKLQALGFGVLPTVRCPFDALTTRETTMLAGVPTRDERLDDKARVVGDVSAVVERDAVLFVEVQTSRESIDGTPLIKKGELRKIRDPDEIEDLIAERRK